MLLETVPNDIWIVIFGSLNVRDLGRVARVCKLFNKLSEEDIIWRAKYQEEFSTRQNSLSSDIARTADENRGWKIRYRFALHNLPLHNILFGTSFVHKLCVHPLERGVCITDRFWMSVYHHSISYSYMLQGVHTALHDSQTSYKFNPTFLPFSVHFRKLKCLMVGDAGVGKRTLLASLAAMDYTPATSSKYQVNVMVHKRVLSYQVDILSDIDQLDKLPDGYDLVMLCFSTADRASFKNIPTWCERSKAKLRQTSTIPPEDLQWLERKALWQDLATKTVLVGTHLDVALEKGVKQELLVSFREADRLAATLEAHLYLECSSKKLTGLAALFVSVSGLFTPLEGYETAVVKNPNPPYQPPTKKGSCIVM